MATLRKLQTEIEKTLKKVNEGLEEFDGLFEQFTESENANQKEKYEGYMRVEIKKLQKYRENIKGWQGNNDVKDKTDLTEARREIERRMEAFKVFEKEAKTKAYSKEGLQAAAIRLDPKERAKQEMREWLSNTVEHMNSEIEEKEAELEELAGGGKKRKGKGSPRVTMLEDTVSRHQVHVSRLEQMMRSLDNDGISVEDVEGVKDLVEDYLERCEESPEEFVNPDDIYMDVIDVLETQADNAVSHLNSKSHKENEARLEKEREEREREKQKAAAAAAKALLAAQGNLRLVASHEEELKKASQTPKSGAMPPPPPPPPPRSGRDPDSPLAHSSGKLSAPGTPVHPFAAIAGSGVNHGDEQFPVLGTPVADSLGKVSSGLTSMDEVNCKTINDDALDAGLDELTGRMRKMKIQESSELPPQQMLQLLQLATPRSLPQPADQKWNLPLHRAKPCGVPTPLGYPLQRLPLFEAPTFYDKIEVETLFYAFYYQPGTMNQFLAIRSLLSKSWKFHKERRVWYQTSENPQIASLAQKCGEPQGRFVYFEHNFAGDGFQQGWMFRYANDLE